MTVFDSSGDTGFEELITQHHLLPLTHYIPKAAHFVHSQIQPQTWLNYAIIRSAFYYLGVEKVSIWVPEDAELPGEMWERIRAMQNVTIRPFTVPTTVWGTRIQRVEHASDIARIKILYHEGGIYMDNDMIALKSSDDVIYSPDTKSTILPRQAIYGQGKAVLNAMIMSKPGSPFLLRWMEKYREFDPSEWDRTSCLVPAEMWNAGEPELTLLHDRTWVYPQLRSNDELRTDRPALSLMWVGKGWHDIGNNYGSHLWKWADGSRKIQVSPEIVRTIDTPIFCKMRRLFDNVDGDGHYSVPVDRNPNCTSTSMVGLKTNKDKLFSDYQMRLDTANTKWVDSSGNRLHGFSQTGTYINRTGESIVREFAMNSQVWLPVPSDWDARVGTVRMKFQLNREASSGTQPIGLFKIRIDYAGEIVVSLVKAPTANALLLNFEWLGTFLAKGEYAQIDNAEWMSDGHLALSETEPNELAITYDRKDKGAVAVFLDGRTVDNGTLPLLPSARIGNEIWLNSREWTNMDTGFRGSMHRFSVYADAVPPHELAKPLPLQSSIDMAPGDKYLDLIFPSILILLLLYFLWRSKNRILRTASPRRATFSLTERELKKSLLP